LKEFVLEVISDTVVLESIKSPLKITILGFKPAMRLDAVSKSADPSCGSPRDANIKLLTEGTVGTVVARLVGVGVKVKVDVAVGVFDRVADGTGDFVIVGVGEK
jgi:hypothetical protein